MRKQKLYFYPPQVTNVSKVVANPYTSNFMKGLSKFFDVVNYNSSSNISIIDVFRYLFKVDIIIFNWIENIGNRKLGFMQFLLFVIAFFILKIRGTRIIWIMHNIHPHQGGSRVSSIVKQMMFRYSDLIVAHSKEAERYARHKTYKPVIFAHHPNNKIVLNNSINFDNITRNENDILIWGTIEPYKGIIEFLDFLQKEGLKWKVKIIGRCKNSQYETLLRTYLSDRIEYENRSVSFDELRSLIKASRYVVFPYISASVSSSGALMDTLSLYGNVIGPNKGAFSDIFAENLCFVFNTYRDIIYIVERRKYISQYSIESFIKKNTWDNFCLTLSEKIISK